MTKKDKYLQELAMLEWGDKTPILISQEAFDALQGFLYEDCVGTGEGYSQFILTAIEMRRATARAMHGLHFAMSQEYPEKETK